jgi:CBS domain-containing protein
MIPDTQALVQFLSAIHPYDAMERTTLLSLADAFDVKTYEEGTELYGLGQTLDGLFIVFEGEVEIRDEHGVPISLLGPRNSFGERGLLRDGSSLTSAKAISRATVLVLPAKRFHQMMSQDPTFQKFFERNRVERPVKADLATTRVEELMATSPLTCSPETTVQTAAELMRDAHVSSICIAANETLLGIATVRDLSGKVVADRLPFDTPIGGIMTPDPVSLPPSAIGSDVLHMMMERQIGHIPVTQAGKLVGIVTQTDLTRFQAVSSAELVSEIAHANSAEDMAKVTARIPRLLAQLVAGGNRHEVITRLITDVADTATRRLLALGEANFGPPPVPYLWLACGSQGRQEQTGVSDQDNCLFLDDSVTDAHMPYFEALARFVCDGLDTCGYVYCPGDMMAINPRWRQPVRKWREYFKGWIKTPNPEAQMLASVMFDLRPIGGTTRLFEDLQAETLKAASANSIYVAHMISNSLKHTPPLGLLRGFATIRSGEHKNQIDLKHNGVVPVVDLGRIYALQGQLTQSNTAARLEAAMAAGVLSSSGGQDLRDAYDLIAETRLEHQAAQVRAGQKPDNFLSPSGLSDFDRSHLRDAFVVIKSMQSAVGHGRGMLS